jgi:hypothetical protein
MPSAEDRPGRIERGIKYPADNLESAIDLLSRVKDSLGYGGASRETLAEALGYRGISGTSARKIGSLTHYDLIERVGNGAYRISELGRSILMPTSAAERQAAIVEAAKRPALFSALFQKYQDHALPTLLPNLLTREHGVGSSAAEQAANTFRETAEYAGLLRNGVLRSQSVADSIATTRAIAEEPSLSNSPTQVQQQGALDRSGGARASDYTIALDGTGRVAILSIPVPATLRDMRRIRAWTDYMTQLLKEESEEAGSE